MNLILSAIPEPRCCTGHMHSSVSHWYGLGRDTLWTVLDHCHVSLDSGCKESAKTVSFSKQNSRFFDIRTPLSLNHLDKVANFGSSH